MRDQSVSQDGPPAPDDGVVAAPWLAEGLTLLETRKKLGPLGPRGLIRLLDRIDSTVPLGFPWCGIFVSHCLKTTLPSHQPPPRYARAKPWLQWGHSSQPQVGALLVFWRLHPKTPLGHVGFYWREDESSFHVLGGNQRDRIGIHRYAKHRLIGVRWPDGVDEPGLRLMAPKEAATPPA